MSLLLFIRSPDPHGDFSGSKIDVDETVITPGPADVELALRAAVGGVGEDRLGQLLGYDSELRESGSHTISVSCLFLSLAVSPVSLQVHASRVSPGGAPGLRAPVTPWLVGLS